MDSPEKAAADAARAASGSAEAQHRLSRLPSHWPRHLVTVLVLGLAVHLLLPQITALQHSLDVIRGITWWVLALAVCSTWMSTLSSGILLNAIARMTGDRLRPVRGAVIAVASNSVGLVAGGIVPAATCCRWKAGGQISGGGRGWGVVPLLDLVLSHPSLRLPQVDPRALGCIADAADHVRMDRQ